MSTAPAPEPCKTEKVQKEGPYPKYKQCLRNKIFRASAFALLATVAICVISITTVYLLNLKGKDDDSLHGHSNNSVIQTTPWTSTVTPTSPLDPWPPEVDFCDLLYCDHVYCCPSSGGGDADFNTTASEFEIPEIKQKTVMQRVRSAGDWTNTTIHTFMIKENQHLIDSKYCLRDECGPERYVFRVPISPFVPVNMRVTLLMNSTELLVVHLCHLDESATCSALLDSNSVPGSRYPSNTQGEHEWPLHVARLYQSSYYFRAAVAGQADCSTDHHYAGALFTDYHFQFYRRCTDS